MKTDDYLLSLRGFPKPERIQLLRNLLAHAIEDLMSLEDFDIITSTLERLYAQSYPQTFGERPTHTISRLRVQKREAARSRHLISLQASRSDLQDDEQALHLPTITPQDHEQDYPDNWFSSGNYVEQ